MELRRLVERLRGIVEVGLVGAEHRRVERQRGIERDGLVGRHGNGCGSGFSSAAVSTASRSAELPGHVVEPAAAEAARRMLHVERTELRRDDLHHAEPGGADVGRGHVDRVRGRTCGVQACADGLDPPPHARHLELRHLADVPSPAAGVEEAGAPGVLVLCIEGDVLVEAPDPLRRRDARAGRVATAQGTRPGAHSHGLVERLLDCRLHCRSRSRPHAERRLGGSAAAGHAEHARQAPEGAQVDRRDADAGRAQIAALELLEPRVPLPGQARPGQAGPPRDHERVALRQLEQTAQHRLLHARVRGEPVARRTADACLAGQEPPREIDELCRQVRRLARGQRRGAHPGDARVAREARIREARGRRAAGRCRGRSAPGRPRRLRASGPRRRRRRSRRCSTPSTARRLPRPPRRTPRRWFSPSRCRDGCPASRRRRRSRRSRSTRSRARCRPARRAAARRCPRRRCAATRACATAGASRRAASPRPRAAQAATADSSCQGLSTARSLPGEQAGQRGTR